MKLDELAAPEIAHVLFQDCDIIRTCSCAIRIGAVYGQPTIRDVRFERIHVEIDDDAYAPMIQQGREAKYTGTRGVHCPALLVMSPKTASSIRGVLLKDITVTGSGRHFPRSVLRGFDADHGIEDVTIENLHLYGKPVRSAEEGRFDIGQHVNNVKFVLDEPAKDD